MKQNKKSNQNMIVKVQESYCQVCFVPFNKTAPKKLDQGQQILYCSKCECRVHKCCYDMEANSNFITPKLRQFVCQRCDKKDLKDKPCIICHRKDGVMKQIDTNQVIHIFCALTHKDIIVTSYYPELTFKKSPQYKQVRNLCGICSKPNATQQCIMQACMKRFHGYCIWLNLKKKQEQEDDPQCQRYYMSSGDNGKFDLTGQLMPRNWIYQQFDKVLSGFQQYGFLVENPEKIKSETYAKYQKEQLESKDDSTLKRGGFAYILCQQHESSVYCNCLNRGSGDMVLCQCCFEWYHQKCVNYNPNQNSDHYICSYCQNFYDIKKKIIEEVRSSKTEHYQLKFQPPKLHLNDFIWILRVIDHRIAGGAAVKMIKQLAKYPLKTSKMELVVRSQNKKKMTNLVDNFTEVYLQSPQHQRMIKPKPVLGLNSEHKPIVLQQNVQYNRKLRKYIEYIQSFARRNNITDSFGSAIHQLKFKQKAIQNTYETILQLSKSHAGYPQIPILKIKVEEFSFMEVIKDLNSGSMIEYQDLEKAVIKAKNYSNVPVYLLKPLLERYQKVKNLVQRISKDIIEKKESTIQTQNYIKKLKQQKILAPKIYKNFHQQRKFIKQLYLFYLKQQGKPLEETVETKDKIEILLRQPPCKPNREIAECVNEFNLEDDPVHQHITQIAKKYSKICVLFEIKQHLKKKVIKLSTLQNLYQKYEKFNIQGGETQIKNLMSTWKSIREKWIEAKHRIEKQIKQLNNIDELSKQIKNIHQIIEQLRSLNIEITDKSQEVPQLGSVNRLENLKTWLDTLVILYTESQLKKNPLTISKLPQGMPRQNPLVQEYFSLKKQHHDLINKYIAIYTRINQKIEILKADPKKSRKDQIKDNLQKPRMTDVNNFIDQLKQSKVNMQTQIKQLTRIVNKSIQIGSKVNKFIASQKHLQSLFKQEQVEAVKKQIDQLRKKVLIEAQICLQNQLKQLYQAEICVRMQKMIITANAQLDKMNKLLKFAEQQGLNHLSTYKRLKSKFQTGNQSTKQINLLKKHEQMLANQAQKMKQSDNFYNSLINFRKSLPLSIPQTLKQKNKHYQDLSARNQFLRKKISLILSQQPKKYQIQEARPTYLQALKHPFQVQGLNKLIYQFTQAQRILQMWKQKKLINDISDDLFIKCDKIIFYFSEIQNLKKQFQSCQQKTQKLHQYRSNGINSQSLEKVQKILKKIEQYNISKTSRAYNKFKLQYYQCWIDFIQHLKIKCQQQQYFPIPYIRVKALLISIYTDIYRNLKVHSNCQQLKDITNYFQDIMIGIKNSVVERGVEVEQLYKGYIDIYALKYQAKYGIDVKQQVKILHPYNDLHKFGTIDLQKATNRQIKYAQQEIIPLKRQRTDRSDFDDPYLKQLKSQKSIKRLVSSDSRIEDDKPIKKLQDWEKNDSSIVSEAQRTKAKQVIYKNIKKNKELASFQNLNQQVRMIENQIFGQNHNQIVKYFEFVNSFEKLFIKLLGCPNISAKVAKKKFQWSFLKLLIDNLQQINQTQAILAQKTKQAAAASEDKKQLEKKQSIKQQKQKQLQKQKQKQKQRQRQRQRQREKQRQRQRQREAKKQIQNKPKQRSIQQMITSGKIDQSVRNQLKKQIKAIRDKNKKKKHKSSRRRSRSRSRSSNQKSPQAKFSSDSEQKQLPVFIEQQYNQTTQKGFTNNDYLKRNQRIQTAPLLYDPDKDAMQQQTVKKNFQKGATLRLKSADLQLSVKRKSKISLKSFMYSTQDCAKITNQLVDPGFNLIQLKRDKYDQQIIQYLNKPSRKKYRFLVGWFEAEKIQQNQYIRDFSIDCNQKKKIFGVQNQHIKMHIMSIHQYVKILQIHDPPNKATTQMAAQILKKDRLVFIIQYPTERMYQIKGTYSNFNNIQQVQNTYNVQVPQPVVISQMAAPMDRSGYIQAPYIMNFNPLLPQQPIKTLQENPLKPTIYEGWGSDNSASSYSLPTFSSQANINPLNQLSRFSPIMTDEQDQKGEEQNKPKNQQKEKQIDLASNILNSLADVPIKNTDIPLSSRAYAIEPHKPQQHVYDSGYNRYPPIGAMPSQPVPMQVGMNQGGMHQPPLRWQPSGGMIPPQMNRPGMMMNPMSIQPSYPLPPQPNPASMMYKNPMMSMGPYNYPPPPPPQNQQPKPPGSQHYDPYMYQRH